MKVKYVSFVYCLSVLRILAGCTFMVVEVDNYNYAVFLKVVDGL